MRGKHGRRQKAAAEELHGKVLIDTERLGDRGISCGNNATRHCQYEQGDEGRPSAGHRASGQ